MQVRINLLTQKYDYLWEYTINHFGGVLPNVGDHIELPFDADGAPAEKCSSPYASHSFQVTKRLVEPGKDWWIEVEGEVPDF